jgi:hypothetical protein
MNPSPLSRQKSGLYLVHGLRSLFLLLALLPCGSEHDRREEREPGAKNDPSRSCAGCQDKDQQ